jgi:hypothetical protein
MTALSSPTRIRQVVVAAADRDRVAAEIVAAFGLGDPYDDPGVREFGLHNAVYAIGDAFFEIVSPVREGTTAGRYLDRQGGDCGYMVIFQVPDIGAARSHLAAEQCRTVWNADFATISGTHLHPVDIGGAIVSIDQPTPPESWMWAGPDWSSRARREIVDGLAGITVASADPAALSQNWARLLGLQIQILDDAPRATLPDGGIVTFEPSSAWSDRSGLVGIDLRAASTPTGQRHVGTTHTIAGTRFRIVAA